MGSAGQTEATTGARLGRRVGMALAGFCLVAGMLFWVEPGDLYVWVKALHVIAVISWMAGLLYLPRLFIYHTESGAGSPQGETFKIMESRLIRLIMNPAMILSWVFGLWLAWYGFQFQGVWLHIKLSGVVGLTATHVYFARSAKDFACDKITKTARHWRIWNEAPTLLMILIVIMVIVKPFL
jgi:protoporphyrinogen IX oxidase